MAILRVLLAAVAFISAVPAARAAETVDLLLVLAADVSRSVDEPKFQLQRDGYAAALKDPRVLDAIMSGANRRIAICFVEWSGASAQKVIIDWTLIDGADAARKFSDALVEAPRPFADRTSISGRDRLLGRTTCTRALSIAAPHHRHLGRRHAQFRTRLLAARGRCSGVRCNHQRPCHPQ